MLLDYINDLHSPASLGHTTYLYGLHYSSNALISLLQKRPNHQLYRPGWSAVNVPMKAV